MADMIKVGTRIMSSHNIEYEIVRFIASGGQGEVYEVSALPSAPGNGPGGNHYALKLYYKHSATPYQRKLIKRLIERGAPDGRFLWPLGMIERNGLFGYIMPLRPSNYKSIVDLMKRRAEPTFSTLCMVGINLADGYHSLHSQGLCYRDISFGNLFFDPENGDVLICDNDNVTVNKDPDGGTNGTPRFIAPEIIRENKYPSTETDLYSMAVLLFYVFMLHHPLEGAKEAEIKCFDGRAMEKIYGREPVFIWDPADTSNRPVPGYQDNAIVFWDIYPQFIRDMFTAAFTEGLDNVHRRVVETQWKEIFARLKDSIMYCQYCNSENFYDERKVKNGEPHICWSCRGTIILPPRIKIGRNIVMLNRDTGIYRHHMNGLFDYGTVEGRISRHPADPNRWGLTNKGTENWIYMRPGNGSEIIRPGKTAPLVSGAKIDFGPVEGEIRAK